MDGGAGCMNVAEVKQENVPLPFDQEESAGSSTPIIESKPLSESHYSTRGIKVRYVSDDQGAEYDSNGNSKKKKRTSRVAVKKEARDNGGVYQPSKKKIYKKIDPSRCQDCRQHLDDSNLKVNH